MLIGFFCYLKYICFQRKLLLHSKRGTLLTVRKQFGEKDAYSNFLTDFLTVRKLKLVQTDKEWMRQTRRSCPQVKCSDFNFACRVTSPYASCIQLYGLVCRWQKAVLCSASMWFGYTRAQLAESYRSFLTVRKYGVKK